MVPLNWRMFERASGAQALQFAIVIDEREAKITILI